MSTKSPHERPLWYTFEGIDATGKTTIVNRLIDDLQHINSTQKLLIFPEFSATKIGKIITENLLGQDRFMSLGYDYPAPLAETLILACDQYLQSEMLLFNSDATIVIGDRGPDSRIAFQSVIIPSVYVELSSSTVIQWLYDIFSLLPKPRKTFLLRASLPSIQTRLVARGELPLNKEQTDFLIKVDNQYTVIAELERERFTIIDTDRPFKEVYSEIKKIITNDVQKSTKERT